MINKTNKSQFVSTIKKNPVNSGSLQWMTQLIFPLHKKNERDCVANYRPVSHLVQVGKMVEYAVYFQIVEHFMTNDIW